MDDELDDCLANIEDVANGLIVDMEHAELMEPLTEACSDLEDCLQIFYTNTERNSIINRMSIAELKTLISSMNAMTKTIENFISRAWMITVERALKNYLVTPNDLDLGFVMTRLAELTKKYCRDLGCPLKKEALVLSKTFSVDLKIGKWPEVLDGKFDPNFRAKTDAILKKKNGDVHIVAKLMLKQCCDTVKKNAGFGK